MQIGIKKQIEVEAKTVRLHTKVCDMCQFVIEDQDGKDIIAQEDGYVPGWFPGEHFGDYLIFDIEIDTGKILNWTPPTPESLQRWIAEKIESDGE